MPRHFRMFFNTSRKAATKLPAAKRTFEEQPAKILAEGSNSSVDRGTNSERTTPLNKRVYFAEKRKDETTNFDSVKLWGLWNSVTCSFSLYAWTTTALLWSLHSRLQELKLNEHLQAAVKKLLSFKVIIANGFALNSATDGLLSSWTVPLKKTENLPSPAPKLRELLPLSFSSTKGKGHNESHEVLEGIQELFSRCNNFILFFCHWQYKKF